MQKLFEDVVSSKSLYQPRRKDMLRTLKPPVSRCVATLYIRSTPSAHGTATEPPSGDAATPVMGLPVRIAAMGSDPAMLTSERSCVATRLPSLSTPCRPGHGRRVPAYCCFVTGRQIQLQPSYFRPLSCFKPLHSIWASAVARPLAEDAHTSVPVH
jgi:hypothetical protein